MQVLNPERKTEWADGKELSSIFLLHLACQADLPQNSLNLRSGPVIEIDIDTDIDRYISNMAATSAHVIV